MSQRQWQDAAARGLLQENVLLSR